MTSIMVNGSESTGSVADRTTSSKNETTGGVAARANYGSVSLNNELNRDTVCFKGKSDKKKKSAAGTIFTLLLTCAGVVGGMGILHKNVNKIGSEGIRNAVKKAECVTEPCYKACSWVKTNCYDKLINMFK